MSRPGRLTAVAHEAMALCNPIPAAVVDDVIAALGPLDGARVLDIGCGKAELLTRLAERGATGAGVDTNPWFLDDARSRIAERGVAGRVTVREADGRSVAGEGPAYDVVCCVGSTHALGEPTGPALATLRGLVPAGGRLVFGEGYWRRTPDPGYLDSLGATAGDHESLAGLAGLVVAAGWTPLWLAVASEADWDRYEWGWALGLDRWAAAHPDDPDAPAYRAVAAEERERYLRWGRDTLGFALLAAIAT